MVSVWRQQRWAHAEPAPSCSARSSAAHMLCHVARLTDISHAGGFHQLSCHMSDEVPTCFILLTQSKTPDLYLLNPSSQN